MNYKQKGGDRPVGGNRPKRPGGAKYETPKQIKKRLGPRPLPGGKKRGKLTKLQGGGDLSEAKKKNAKSFIESSKEVKFGRVPGGIRRAAEKTAKGKANMAKGLKALGDANTRKEGRKAARTMKKGSRQINRGAKIKDNYEFRQAVKRGEAVGPEAPIGTTRNKGSQQIDKKFLGGIGRIAGAIKGAKGAQGQGLGAMLKGAAKGAAGGGLLGRGIGALRAMKGAAGQGGGLRGMLKAGAQGAMQGALGGGGGGGAAAAEPAAPSAPAAVAKAQPAAPAEDMGGEEMKRGGLKDRRQRGGCRKGQPCEAYDGGRGPKTTNKRKKVKPYKTRVRGRAKFQQGGCVKGQPCPAYDGGNSGKVKKAKKIKSKNRRNRNRHWGRPKV